MYRQPYADDGCLSPDTPVSGQLCVLPKRHGTSYLRLCALCVRGRTARFFPENLGEWKKHRTFAPLSKGSNLVKVIVSWCNGSTTDFGSVCLGSNPNETTSTRRTVLWCNGSTSDSGSASLSSNLSRTTCRQALVSHKRSKGFFMLGDTERHVRDTEIHRVFSCSTFHGAHRACPGTEVPGLRKCIDDFR